MALYVIYMYYMCSDFEWELYLRFHPYLCHDFEFTVLCRLNLVRFFLRRWNRGAGDIRDCRRGSVWREEHILKSNNSGLGLPIQYDLPNIRNPNVWISDVYCIVRVCLKSTLYLKGNIRRTFVHIHNLNFSVYLNKAGLLCALSWKSSSSSYHCQFTSHCLDSLFG